MGMKKLSRSVIFWVVLALLLVLLLQSIFSNGEDRDDLSLSEFRRALAAGEVSDLEIKDRDSAVLGELDDGTLFKAEYVREFGDELVQEIEAANPPVEYTVDRQEQSIWTSLLFSLLPIPVSYTHLTLPTTPYV